ncbi:hypothetical protein BU24DRAFT_408683 [Aaosphaeria arxii CBS 175.79]|uniref:Zn(2)-C6 fungal-type domain-containing protein n=1 Tax=Aaosphaeria arxii CBS 175.79 TaxID=1450172 RepID=A0A6A5XQN2_9PLEO|nr:uncharacterized protein BU24DRAFT_408683 [Aaosphaeria arxii CBS 175.79]KAF2015472.1 hypothetical protein BU24DRAFT_408683 [Aaosphaeria arxii CBS 175.79]
MNELEDELDLRYHRGMKPDVYYRCPTLESLDGALRNELEKSATSFVPTQVVTEFVFANTSTITISVSHQGQLEPLGLVPADFPQSITVEHAFCRNLEGKERLKVQRAIARSFIESIQEADGFRYSERQATINSDGSRFKYVCWDSLQNRDRKRNSKKENVTDQNDSDEHKSERANRQLPTFDCKGAIHIKFSFKRDAVNVIYIHNPIHRDTKSRQENEQENSPLPAVEKISIEQENSPEEPPKPRKSRKKKSALNELDHANTDPQPSAPQPVSGSPKKRRTRISGSIDVPEPSTAAKTKKRRTNSSGKVDVSESSTGSKTKKTQASSTGRPTIKTPIPLPTPAPTRTKGACIRCREKKIKCDYARPTCNQCQRGLWTCQYPVPRPPKRSKNGCTNCRQRRRKCTEEKPSCAHCIKLDDDCEYP